MDGIPYLKISLTYTILKISSSVPILNESLNSFIIKLKGINTMFITH